MTHSNPPEFLGELIRSYAGPPLRSAQFQRKHLVWNRNTGLFVHVLEIQRSRWNDQSEAAFTINVGVWSPDVWNICWSRPRPRTITAADCFPHFRVGSLMDSSERSLDVWWTVRTAQEINGVGQELHAAINDICIPWLDRAVTYDAILELAGSSDKWKVAADRLSYAVLTHLAGRWDEARRLLYFLQEDRKLGAWHERIHAVLGRMDERKRG